MGSLLPFEIESSLVGGPIQRRGGESALGMKLMMEEGLILKLQDR